MSQCIECARVMHPADASQDLVCGKCKFYGKRAARVVPGIYAEPGVPGAQDTQAPNSEFYQIYRSLGINPYVGGAPRHA